MEISGFWPVFLTGAFGAALVEILRWWKLRELPPEELPAYATSLWYWGITLAMICVSGALATFYGLDARNALMVINVGASTPAIIGAALGSPGGTKPEDRRTRRGGYPIRSTQVARIRQFLAFGR